MTPNDAASGIANNKPMKPNNHPKANSVRVPVIPGQAFH
jgi:hypothetical protein